MRSTLVPAQITTLEDRVTANLSMRQILIFILVIFINIILFCLLPPFFKLDPIKITLSLLISIQLMTLAIRVKGHLILDHLLLMARYKFRPRIYLHAIKPLEIIPKLVPLSKNEFEKDKAAVSNDSNLNNLGKLNLHPEPVFTIKKGALYVIKNET